MADRNTTRLTGSGYPRRPGHPFAIRPVADPRPGPVRRTLAGLGGLAAAAGLLAAPPVLLVTFAPLGLPDRAPSWSTIWETLAGPDDGSLFFAGLTLVCWLAWAGLVASIMVEAWARIRRRPALRIPLLGPEQWLAATLVGAITLLGSAGTYRAAVAHPVAATTSVPVSDAHGAGAAGGHTAASRLVYVVAAGDQLGAIARRFLGDTRDYPRLATDNTRSDPGYLLPGERILLPGTAVDRGPRLHATGHLGAEAAVYVVADGDRLSGVAARYLGDPARFPELRRYGGIRDPDEIRPGQRIVLPADAHDRGARPHATGTTQPIRPAAPAPDPAPGPSRPAPAHPAPAAPSPPAPSAPATTPPGPARPSRPATPPAAGAPARPPADDGVAPPRPAAPSAAGSSNAVPAPGAGPAPSAAPSSSPAPGGAHREDGAVLPSGVWVATGVAAAVSSLLLALRLHRRRGYRPRWPIPSDPADVEPVPLPISVAALETAARRAAGTGPDPVTSDDEDPPVTAAVRVAEPPHDGDEDWAPPPDPAAATVAVGSGGQPVSLHALSAAGTVLHGPGALAAGRAILATALTGNATSAEETSRYTVLTTTATLAALLPAGRQLPPHLSVDVYTEPGDAVRHWAGQLQARRSLSAPTRPDLTGPPGTPAPPPGAGAEPGPPPLLLLAAGLTGTDVATVRGTLPAGHRHHLGAILLDTIAPAPAYLVTADGTALHGATPTTTAPDAAPDSERSGAARTAPHSVSSARPGARISTLTETDLAGVLELLTATPPALIQIDHTDPPPRADTARSAEPGPEPGPRPRHAPPATAAATAASEDYSSSGPVPATGEATPLQTPQTGSVAPLVRLRLLGRPRFTAAATGDTISGIRSASYVLAAALTVHPEGRTLDQLATDLAPDGDPTATKARVRTGITSLRSRLRASLPNGTEQPAFVRYDNGVYRLDAASVAVDVWDFHTALKAANTAADDTHRMAALRRATGLYRGEFAEGIDQLWTDPYREEYRRRATDASVRLAHLLEHHHPDTALDILHDAIARDPLNEYLYREAMRIQATQKRPDAIRLTLRHLETRLFDALAADVSTETRQAADEYLHSAAAHARPSPGRVWWKSVGTPQ